MRNSLKGRSFRPLAFVPLILLVAASWAAAPRAFAVPYVTEQLTSNSYGDERPRINASGQVVWQGWDGADWEIFFYDPANGIAQLTDNSYFDQNPRINDSGRVVWRGWDGSVYRVFLYDPADGATTQISTTITSNWSPQINASGQVVWVGYDGAGYEIFLYDPADGATTQLTDNSYYDWSPQINDAGQVVWVRGDAIFLYDPADGNTTQISTTSNVNNSPQINDAGQVVWWGRGDSGWYFEIFLYDPETGTTTNISDNPFSHRFPQINAAGQVVWRGWDGSVYRVFLYDPADGATTKIAASSYFLTGPQINTGGQVVWQTVGGIFLYDPSNGATTNIPTFSFRNSDPQINDASQVVWHGSYSTDSDIFLATPAVQIVTIDIVPGSDLNVINLNAGAVSVAFLSDSEFEATTVVPESIDMHGAGVKRVGKSGKYMCSAQDANHDGLMDLVCQMDLSTAAIEAGQTEMTLTAETTVYFALSGKTKDGRLIVARGVQFIQGTDSVHVLH